MECWSAEERYVAVELLIKTNTITAMQYGFQQLASSKSYAKTLKYFTNTIKISALSS